MDATWTYGGDIDTSDLDWIRFTIGDTDSTMPLLVDAEIQAALSMQGSKSKAARTCMEAIIIKLARDCDYQVGPERVSASQRYENYKAFYVDYKKSISAGSTIPQAPATGQAIFAVGMMDETSSTSSGLGE